MDQPILREKLQVVQQILVDLCEMLLQENMDKRESFDNMRYRNDNVYKDRLCKASSISLEVDDGQPGLDFCR